MKQESEEAALALSPFAEMGRGAPTIHAEGDEPARLVAVYSLAGPHSPGCVHRKEAVRPSPFRPTADDT